MSKPQKYRVVEKFLKSEGWEKIRQRGSHESWINSNDPSKHLTLAEHKGEISAGQISQLRRVFPNTPQNWK